MKVINSAIQGPNFSPDKTAIKVTSSIPSCLIGKLFMIKLMPKLRAINITNNMTPFINTNSKNTMATILAR